MLGNYPNVCVSFIRLSVAQFMHLMMPSLIEGFYITFSGLRIMSLRLTLFPYNVDGMPQEPKSRLFVTRRFTYSHRTS